MVSFGEAARISGLNESTFRNLKARTPGLFESALFTDSPGAGRAGEVNRVGVIFLSIFARLAAFGLSPSNAHEATLHFITPDEVNSGWVGVDPKSSDVLTGSGLERRVGEPRGSAALYPNGLTLLLVTNKEFDNEHHRLARKLPDRKLSAQLLNVSDDAGLDHGFLRFHEAFIILNLNEIVGLVDRELGGAEI